MKIKLNRKSDTTDKDPLIVMMKEPVKFCEAVKIGETLEVDEELGYAILGDRRYKGLFSMDKSTVVAKATETLKQPVNKRSVATKSKAIQSAPQNKSLKSMTAKTVETISAD